MDVIGVREARQHLSRYLDLVQDGEELVVTDRGKAVARVLPMSGGRTIDRLIAEGLVTPAANRKQPASRPIKAAGTVSDLVPDQRR